MDINLARTFLEIAASRSFVQAAARLNVTQTAVSARVRTLEELLGRQLFLRNKAGASLTPAGEQFHRYAQALVQVWDRARHEMSMPPGSSALLAAGCEPSLWDPLVLDWLQWMRKGAPGHALYTDIGKAEDLLDRVTSGMLDLAVLYAPRHRPGLRIELLFEEKLVLVSTTPGLEKPDPASYVYVDWGGEYGEQHHLAFPDLGRAGVSVNFGPLGLEYLLANGGAGYFRQSVAARHVTAGRLHWVAGAPQFLYPAYVVYPTDADAAVLQPALAGLREVAARAKAAQAARPVRGGRPGQGRRRP
jgi:DNA-binding transcriptional LysR family regulator